MPKTKDCKYSCGKKLEWSEEPRGYFEEGTHIKHSYQRCAELLEQQGKPVSFPDKPDFKRFSKNKFNTNSSQYSF